MLWGSQTPSWCNKNWRKWVAVRLRQRQSNFIWKWRHSCRRSWMKGTPRRWQLCLAPFSNMTIDKVGNFFPRACITKRSAWASHHNLLKGRLLHTCKCVTSQTRKTLIILEVVVMGATYPVGQNETWACRLTSFGTCIDTLGNMWRFP